VRPPLASRQPVMKIPAIAPSLHTVDPLTLYL
jgi:hypothetical protein